MANVGRLNMQLGIDIGDLAKGLNQSLSSIRDWTKESERLFASSAANVTASIQKQKDAWAGAMKSLRQDVKDKSGLDPRGNSRDMLGWYSLERMNAPGRSAEYQSHARRRALLPFGMSMRTEMSVEAAKTAAALGSATSNIVNKLRSSGRDIADAGLGAAGFGGVLGRFGAFAGAHPFATGAAVAGGAIVKAQFDRDRLAREVGSESKMLGQGTADWSRVRAAGVDASMMSRFQRSIAERSEGFSKLGLDPEKLSVLPLNDSLLKLADAFAKIKNPADIAQIAMDLFGKSGAEIIPVLSELRAKMGRVSEAQIISPEDVERVKAWDNALSGAANAANRLALSLGNIANKKGEVGWLTEVTRGWEGLLTIAAELAKTRTEGHALQNFADIGPALDKLTNRWESERIKVKYADQFEQDRLGGGDLLPVPGKKIKDNADAARKPFDELGKGLERTLATLGMDEFAKMRFDLTEAAKAAPELQALLGARLQSVDDWERMSKALEINTEITGFYNNLRTTVSGIGLDEFAKMRQQVENMAIEGADPWRVEDAMRLVDQFERVSKLQKDIDRAKEIEKQMRTPRQQFDADVAEMNRLVASGNLQPGVAGQFLAKQAMGMVPKFSSYAGVTPALEMGSAEAYNALYGSASDPQKQAVEWLQKLFEKTPATPDLKQAFKEALDESISTVGIP